MTDAGLDAAYMYEQARSLGLVDEALFDRLTDSIAASLITVSDAQDELESLLVAAAAAESTNSMLALPQELLPILCLSLSERDVFASLCATCRAMAATIMSKRDAGRAQSVSGIQYTKLIVKSTHKLSREAHEAAPESCVKTRWGAPECPEEIMDVISRDGG